MKPVLIVSYHYPPSPAVGGVRPSRFAACLPQYGWEPVVLTTTAGTDGAAISSDSGDLHRVAEWPHPLKVYERWQERRAARRSAPHARAAEIEVPYEQCFAPAQGRGWKRALLSLLSLPDRELGWLPPAVMAGRRLIQARRIGHLITTGPPFTCHLVGLLLHRLTGVNWIADFRDPWSLSHKFPIFRSTPSDALESRLIKAVMRRAHRVLCVTPAMTDEARKEHLDVPVDRFQTLTSGFDPVEFEAVPWEPRPPVPVVFSYFGTFYHGRTPGPFLEALAGLIREGAVPADAVRVQFVGQVTRADGRSVAELVNRVGLTSIVTLHAPVRRAEALRWTLESHVVLVLDERHPVQIPLKLYDALAAGPVILNIGSYGAVADVLSLTGRGIAVHHQNPAEVRQGVLEAFQRARDAAPRQLPWNDASIAEFDFRRLTHRLAEHLESLR